MCHEHSEQAKNKSACGKMSSPTLTSFDLRVHLSRGASYLIMQNMGSAAAGIVAFVILARMISTTEMGVWAVLQLLVAACSTFATWLPQSVTKYVAENSSRGSRSAAAAVFYQALRVNLVTYLPVIVGFYFGASFLASHLLGNASYAPLIRVLAFDVFLNAGMLQVLVAALLGLKMFRETAAVGLAIEGILRQVLIVSLVLVLRSFFGLVVGWLFSDAATVVIYMVLAVRALGRPRLDFPLVKLFRFYLPLEVAQIVGFFQAWFDRAILLLFVPLATLGVYNVAVTAYGVVANVSGGIGGMLFPALSSIQEKGPGKDGLRGAIGLGTRYACLIVTPVDFILLATATPALAVFVGESYVGGSLPLMIFCAADALTLFATVLNPAFMTMEETMLICVIKGITAIVGLTAMYLLLPTWGIVGASAGRALTVILTAMLQGVLITRKIRLKFDVRSVVKILAAGISSAGVIVLLELVKYSKFMLPVYVIVGTFGYLILLRFLRAIDADDLELLRRFLGKRLLWFARLLDWILLASDKKDAW